MRNRNAVLMTMAFLLAAVPAFAQLDLPRASPKAKVMQQVGLTDVTITYGRPSVRGRTIWGELVPYGRVWRTGANEATTISFSDDVMINGQKLSKGTYSFHTIPERDQWTLIFNKVGEQWGSYSYDESQDALRLRVKPQVVDHSHEMMTFEIPKVSANSAEVALVWDRLKVPFTVEVDTNAKVLADIKDSFNWRIPYQAANWAYQNKVHMDDAAKWLDASIAMEETGANLSLKARMLAEQGKTREAIAAGEKAVKAAKASNPNADTSSMEKMIAEWKSKRR